MKAKTRRLPKVSTLNVTVTFATWSLCSHLQYILPLTAPFTMPKPMDEDDNGTVCTITSVSHSISDTD